MTEDQQLQFKLLTWEKYFSGETEETLRFKEEKGSERADGRHLGLHLLLP